MVYTIIENYTKRDKDEMQYSKSFRENFLQPSYNREMACIIIRGHYLKTEKHYLMDKRSAHLIKQHLVGSNDTHTITVPICPYIYCQLQVIKMHS